MGKTTPTLIFKPVVSSQIKEIAFDKPRETLYVRFNNGGKVYSYTPVSLETYDKLMKADSIGKYYHANIRKAVKGRLENSEQFKK